MQANDFQQRVLERLDRLAADLEQNNQRIEETNKKVEETNKKVEVLTQELALTNTRVDTYQKASNQVVNLAFGLIATATITIVVSVLLK